MAGFPVLIHRNVLKILINLKSLTNLSNLLNLGTVILLLMIAIYDFRHRKIPDRMIAGLFIWSLIYLAASQGVDVRSRMTGGILLFLVSSVITCLIPGAFGGGDVKLLGVCGFLLKAGPGMAGFCISILCAGFVCTAGMLMGRIHRKDQIAFGPYISFGMSLALFFGGPMIRWYLS